MSTLLDVPERTAVASGSKQLAVLRVVAGVAVVYLGVVWWDYPIPPEGLRFPPRIFDLSFLPVNRALHTLAIVLMLAGGLAVTAGWHHRVGAWVATGGFIYAGWITTLTGKVNHTHHVGWFLVLVAVAPAASAWALRREPWRGSEKWAMAGFCALLGLTYFSAGLAKVRHGGFGWGATLVDIIDIANTRKGLPAAPDWMHGPLGSALGTGALMFELLFLPLIVWPRTRRWVWPAGVVFHVAVWWLMGINFATLWPFYLVFLPWQPEVADQPVKRPQAYATSTLLTLVTVFALLGIENAWPFSSYPAFARPAGAVLVVDVDGEHIGGHPYAATVGRESANVHALLASRSGRLEEFAGWLGAEEVVLSFESP